MASRLLARLRREEEGQSIVELSLCAGFLCLMLLAVWQVGTVFSNFIDMSEAAREGARAAAIAGAPTTTGDTASFTQAQADGANAAACTVSSNCLLTSSSVPGMTVTISAVTAWQAGSRVRATVSAPYKLTLFGVAITNGTMTVTDDMRVHRQGS